MEEIFRGEEKTLTFLGVDSVSTSAVSWTKSSRLCCSLEGSKEEDDSPKSNLGFDEDGVDLKRAKCKVRRSATEALSSSKINSS